MSVIKVRSSVSSKPRYKASFKAIKKLLYKILYIAKPPIDISNEYINWLYNINAGMLVAGNLYCIEYAIANLPSDAPIIEIGAFCGLSTNVITYYKHKHNKANSLFTCDPWDFEDANRVDYLGDTEITVEEYREFARETFIRNVNMFSNHDLPIAIETYSDDFFSAWRKEISIQNIFGGQVKLGGRISFAYIDGNHSSQQVWNDFSNVDEFLEPGGFILFDDSADVWGWEGVIRVVSEVSKNKNYALIIKNPNYLFQKVIH